MAQFFVVVSGQVESALFEDYDRLFAKVNFVHNGEGVEDWTVVDGAEAGLTQVARKSVDGGSPVFVFNYPIEVAYASTNVSGWPRLLVSMFSINGLGNHTLAGYGFVHVPTAPGRYTRYVRTFRPRSSSLWQRINAWLFGDPPEFLNLPKVLGDGKGREVARVVSSGVVKVTFNVSTKGLSAAGYSESASSVAAAASSTA
ncbi:B9 domain-containing protein 1 [Thecamonas trahens ATCC 50062]|uniref:B9 domain-containing protein 1 n=1 Tax=Thecamonas trahens ATCC 50062 TaxID=461836 RepID=A0A0L0D458_THETB|nr:B9 domain-containing protein 1 [Thecamonas trahens ATCC 50062]KNC47040.1 B9 domain-containing protein 1 [Thecamonas trahens ATCC 50062]|eukprot:XP_013759820.1 B9 domain-containing protein 1 [Thecamonas trahens ATCC 50062]